MKKSLTYFLPIMGLMLFACANEETLKDIDEPNQNSVANNYISINIVPSSGLSSRADNDQGDDGTYRDGTTSENKINSVRFFFFDSTGEPTPVRVVGQGQYESFLDWYPDENTQYGDAVNGETIEKSFKVTLGIFVPEDDIYSKPASVIAVINPSSAVIDIVPTNTGTTAVAGPSLDDLKGCISDYRNELVENNFVMSNSAYVVPESTDPVKPAQAYLETSLIKDDDSSYFKASIEAALDDPVVIYVERVVARLDLWVDIKGGTELEGDNAGTIIYPLTVIDPATGKTNDQVTIDGTATNVYIKFLGWNITSTPDRSNLLKWIDASWTSKDLFSDLTKTETSYSSWTIPAFHRSFWAMTAEGAEMQFGDFDGSASTDNPYPATGLQMPDDEDFVTVYLQENASPFDSTMAATAPGEDATKVIIACQLVDEDGNYIPLAEWGFRKFSIENLKTYLLGTICQDNNFFIRENKNGETSYRSLTSEDVEFISANKRFPNGLPDGVNNYYAYLVLSDNDATYTEGDEQDAPTVTVEYINDYFLDKAGYSMVWEEGYSYYYFDIIHLGNPGSVGHCGIVRNHIYDTHLNSIVGIGTPVLDPSETIYPEKPEYEESIIAAKINILQWRVVSNSYDIQW